MNDESLYKVVCYLDQHAFTRVYLTVEAEDWIAAVKQARKIVKKKLEFVGFVVESCVEIGVHRLDLERLRSLGHE